jgi:hypothetical protein
MPKSQDKLSTCAWGVGLGFGEFMDLWFRNVEERFMGLCYELIDGLMSYLMAIWSKNLCGVLPF